MSTETSQAQLIQLAQKHSDNPAVSALLLSLTEGRHMAERAFGATQAMCQSYGEAVKGTEGYRVPLDSSELVAQAAKANAAMSRMNADFGTLASVLLNLGESLVY